jgi:hypothetical protein
MKKLVALIALALLGTVAMAQDKKDRKGVTLREGSTEQDTTGVYCATMKGDNVVISGEKENQVADSKKLPNGSVLYSDGVMKRKDGSYYLLKEGECVNKDGDVLHKDEPRTKDEPKDKSEPKDK